MENEGRIGELVDTGTYPIDDPCSGRAGVLVERVREELAADGSSTLPRFLRPQALRRMAAQAEALVPLAYPGPSAATPYFFDYRLGEGLPVDDGHPLRRKTPRRMAQVAADLIPHDHLLSRLYRSGEMLAFLQRVLARPVYRNADPYQSLNISVMEEGGCQQWHFDSGDTVTTLLLQAPEAGGVFEYVPDVRSDENENFEAVRLALDGDHPGVRRLRLRAGTLALFRGHYSLHRVTPVQGKRRRLQAILGYATRPGLRGSLDSSVLHYGPRVLQHGPADPANHLSAVQQ